MDRVPHAVDVGDLVRHELDDEQRDREPEDQRVGQHLERLGQMHDPEPLEQADGRDGRVEVEPGGERGPEGEAEGLERRHVVEASRGARRR